MEPGRLSSVVVASEPLTKSTAGWIEAPEYSMLVLERGEDGAARADLWELA
jgi:predicted glutamine amidotransferase